MLPPIPASSSTSRNSRTRKWTVRQRGNPNLSGWEVAHYLEGVVQLKDRTARKVITRRISCGVPAPKRGGKVVGAPKALDHFVITGVEEQDDGSFLKDEDAMAAVSALDVKRYGPPDKLRKIPIRVSSDYIPDVLLQKYRARRSLPVFNSDGSAIMVQTESDEAPKHLQRLTVWCEGDGKVATRRHWDKDEHFACLCNASPKHKERTRQELEDVLTGKVKYDPRTDTMRCPFAQLSGVHDPTEGMKKSPSCKPETVLIERIDGCGGLGVFSRFRSHGHQTADRLASTIDEIKAAMPGGVLCDIPLDLCLQMVPTNIPGRNGRRAQPVIHVELRLTVEATIALSEDNLRRRLSIAASADENRRLLHAAQREVEEESVEGEFTLVSGRDASGGVRT